MAFSIQTNNSSLIALTNFEKASAELDDVSKVISTGLNISSSEDDSSNFSIAQGIRGEVKSIDAYMARASARLTSSQVQKELAPQTVSVAT